MTDNTVEILAPAGSFEALTAAIQAGADAVYFGIEQLNLRARASNNFTTDDLINIVRQCHDAQVKAFLTLNTVLYDHDMQLMRRIMDNAKACNIDGVIVSDHAAMAYGKSIGLPLHISTQSNISNIETVQFFAAFADVMVLARELTLKQIADIAREIKRRNVTGPSGQLVRLEVFVHGALCMAISGKCYLSLHTQFASANRGACIQNCRRPYTVIDKDEGYEFEVDNEYIMSAKDLCTIDILDQILDTGVSVLKIEGRGKPADYVFTATRSYKEAVLAIAAGNYTADKIEHWKTELTKVYNRGFWEGYYLGRELGEWTDQYGSSATEKKEYAAKGVKYYPNLKVGEFVMEAGSLTVNDAIMIMGKNEGVHQFTLTELRVDGQVSTIAKRGDKITFPCEVKIWPGDKLYKVIPTIDA